jgi:hypothetical protein
VALNSSTASAETSDHLQHSGGLVSEANDPNFQALLPAGAKLFADPVAFFNNIFYNNEACTLDHTVVPPSLVGCNAEVNNPSATYIDFEIHGVATSTATSPQEYTNARYNLVTNGNVLQPDRGVTTIPGGASNIVGVNPLFINPLGTQFAVAPSRLDPQRASVTITAIDPPVGIPSDYHLQRALAANLLSGAVDRGVRCSNTPIPPPNPNPLVACTGTATQAPLADIDGQLRPQPRTPRGVTTGRPWDFGADEIPLLTPVAG